MRTYFAGALLSCLLFVPVLDVMAYTGWEDRLPNGSVFGCNNCHGSGNHFIDDFEGAGNRWTSALAAMDSDGDSYTNGIELQDLEGTWQEGQADPGNPELVTNPGSASSHPQLSPTPSSIPDPTATPQLEPTATPTQSSGDTPTPEPPTPAPTPTGQTCSKTSVDIMMPKSDFTMGDTCYVKAAVCNQESTTLRNYHLVVVLSAYGTFYFAPGFTESFDSYQSQIPSFEAGETPVMILGEFTWPGEVGTGNGLIWFAGLTDPAVTQLIGDFGQFTFGWH